MINRCFSLLVAILFLFSWAGAAAEGEISFGMSREELTAVMGEGETEEQQSIGGGKYEFCKYSGQPISEFEAASLGFVFSDGLLIG